MSPRKKTVKPVGETRDEKKVNKELDALAIEFPGPTPEFANSREFAQALAEKCNLVGVGSSLLQGADSKNASVRARMFETTLEYLYGKPPAAPAAETPAVQIIWDMPGPDRERIPE